MYFIKEKIKENFVILDPSALKNMDKNIVSDDRLKKVNEKKLKEHNQMLFHYIKEIKDYFIELYKKNTDFNPHKKLLFILENFMFEINLNNFPIKSQELFKEFSSLVSF